MSLQLLSTYSNRINVKGLDCIEKKVRRLNGRSTLQCLCNVCLSGSGSSCGSDSGSGNDNGNDNHHD